MQRYIVPLLYLPVVMTVRLSLECAPSFNHVRMEAYALVLTRITHVTARLVLPVITVNMVCRFYFSFHYGFHEI